MAEDTCFIYDNMYLRNANAKPISLSLPLQKEAFSCERTRNFFEGLLPEGYTRRCIAAEMCVDADDYISILKNLGKECLGAIQIYDENDVPATVAYEEMTQEQLHMFAKEGAMESATLVTKSHLSLTGASGKAGLYYDKIRLAPAYDIVSILIYESSTDEMALCINGKTNIYDVIREDLKKCPK